MPHPTDIHTILNDLQTVRSHGEFPKGRNYLYSFYKNQGYVRMGNKKTIGTGKNKRTVLTPDSKVKLTKKGYQIVKIANKNNQFLGSI